MKWCRSLAAVLIALVALTPLPSGAQNSTDIPTPGATSPDSSGNAVPRAPQAPVSYVGLSYQILPIGLQDFGGWLVGEPVEGRLYSIAHVQQEQQQMLWFQVIVAPDSQGRVGYKVIDIVKMPQLQSSEELVGSPGLLCMQNGVRNPELVAIATYNTGTSLRQIKRAWRANRNTGKFEEISPNNVVCDNTSQRV